MSFRSGNAQMAMLYFIANHVSTGNFAKVAFAILAIIYGLLAIFEE